MLQVEILKLNVIENMAKGSVHPRNKGHNNDFCYDTSEQKSKHLYVQTCI